MCIRDRHPIVHHRNRGLPFQQAGGFFHSFAQADEAGLGAQHRELQVQHQQVEALGIFTFRVQRGGQSRHFARQLGERLRRQDRPGFGRGVTLDDAPLRPHDKVVQVLSLIHI